VEGFREAVTKKRDKTMQLKCDFDMQHCKERYFSESDLFTKTIFLIKIVSFTQ